MRDIKHFRVFRLLFLAISMLFLSSAASAQIGISVSIAPPEIPVYDQPICPGDGYIWTPGYWAWDGEYYWVPGTWVMAPQVGYLWTPGYWGWGGSGFVFYDGYWGPTVGFYGGINYGFGYFGHGYEGGRWQGRHFFYNSFVNHVNERSVHNVYNTRVNEHSGNRVSFNGGNGGINERANSQEEAAAHQRHIGPVATQSQHAYSARNNPQQRISANHGTPPVMATPRPNVASHPKDLPPIERSTANTGNARLDQRYQKQQDSVNAKQNQERQRLQQKQDNQHQQLTRQNAPPQRMQQMEQQHQQQTQQMQQRHTQQNQQMQQRQQPSGGGGSRGGEGGHR